MDKPWIAWGEMAQSPSSPSVIELLSFLLPPSGLDWNKGSAWDPPSYRDDTSITATNHKLGPGLALSYS